MIFNSMSKGPKRHLGDSEQFKLINGSKTSWRYSTLSYNANKKGEKQEIHL